LDELLESQKKTYEVCRSYAEKLNESTKKKRCTSFEPKSEIKQVSLSSRLGATQSPSVLNSSSIPLLTNFKRGRLLTSLNRSETDDKTSTASNADLSKFDFTSSRSSSPCSISLDLNEDNNQLVGNLFSDSKLSQPEDDDDDDIFLLTTVTIVMDSNGELISNKWLLHYVIEKLADYHSTTNKENMIDKNKLNIKIYDISSKTRPKTNVLQTFPAVRSEDYELTIVDEFEVAFTSDLIISLVSTKAKYDNSISNQQESNPILCDESFRLYEENLFSLSSLEGKKYISLGALSYENAQFYHYFFNFNNVCFIESPLLCSSQHLTEASYANAFYNSHIYLATCNTDFYRSIKNFFNWVKHENLVYKTLELGLPSVCVNLIQPVVSINEVMLSELKETIPKLAEKLNCDSNSQTSTLKRKSLEQDPSEAKKKKLLHNLTHEVVTNLTRQINSLIGSLSSTISGSTEAATEFEQSCLKYLRNSLDKI